MKKILKLLSLLFFLVLLSVDGGMGNVNTTGTVSLFFSNYRDSEIVRIHLHGDDMKFIAYHSIDISIISTIIVPITIKNIIFSLSVGESYSGLSILFPNGTNNSIEIEPNKSSLLNMKDNLNLYVPIHSTGSLRIVFNSEFINIKDTYLEKEISFPENGSKIDFFFNYPSEYFVSNPNTYYTTTNTLKFETFTEILVPSIVLLLLKKKVN